MSSESMPREDDGRIGLELRVAVTGHRWLNEGDSAALAAAESALKELRARCINKSTDATPVGITIVTSLADGADRLIARAGLRLGARLEVVVPLPLKSYRTDFVTRGSQDSFDELLAHASLVVVAGGQRARPDAYGAAGREVLARSDALVAMWDGEPSRGTGGTADIVDQARTRAVPLCWLRVTRPSEGTPAVVVEVREMPDAVKVLSREGFDKLDWFNRQRVPPRPEVPTPVTGFPRTGAFAGHTFRSFHRADHLAGRMQRLLRTVNRLLYSLAVVAVAVVAFQVIFAPAQPGIVWAEFAALAVILIALIGARRSRLLERWLSLRYLAERIRSLAYMAELTGPSLFIGEVSAPVVNPLQEWIRRALDEVASHAPMQPAAPEFDLAGLKNRLLGEWVRPQLAYQQEANRVARRRQKFFSYTTFTLFGVSLVAAFLHSTGWLDSESRPDLLGFVSLVVPSAAAALSGYSAQRDYARQAIRSAVMQTRLATAAARLARAGDLGQVRQVAVSVELALQGEAADWYTAVRLHEPEVP